MYIYIYIVTLYFFYNEIPSPTGRYTITERKSMKNLYIKINIYIKIITKLRSMKKEDVKLGYFSVKMKKFRDIQIILKGYLSTIEYTVYLKEILSTWQKSLLKTKIKLKIVK